MLINKIYYSIKPFIPRPLQISVRRIVIAYKRKKYHHIWPIDHGAGTSPKGWQGWPDDKKYAVVLSHDVDTQKGHDQCYKLMEIEESIGYRSSFNFVPERYNVSKRLRNDLVDKGFEVGVHGLTHDGKLFSSKKIFQKRAIKINQYINEYKAVGFRSPAMHHDLNWIHELNLEYDASTFDTDPFEPQSDGIGTIFPIWIKNRSNGKGYVELPYTLAQDFTLFILMKEQNIDIWKKKLDWIAEKGGMALLNTHPDYMNYNKQISGNEEYAVERYIEFLEYIKNNYRDQYWQALPKNIARFWKQKYSHL